MSLFGVCQRLAETRGSIPLHELRIWRSILLALCLLLPRPVSADSTTGLVGRWALDETSGNTAADWSGFNNTGTLINGPTWNGAGQIGGALSFDGVNDYVTLGNPASLIPRRTITLAGWMKLTDISANRFVISKYDGVAPHNDTFLRYQAGTGVACSVGGTAAVAAAKIETGRWYHVACTYDAASIRVYLDGALIKTLAKTGPIADEVGTAWLIGARTPANPGAFMSGLLDDVRIYERALTSADITRLLADGPVIPVVAGPPDTTQPPPMATRFDTSSNWATFIPAANGVSSTAKGFKGGVFDGRYAYFVPNFKGNSEVMRFDTRAPFTAPSSWATYDPNPPSGGGYVGGAFDGRYIYFAPYHNGTQSIGEVLRYDTQSPFTTQASWSTFDPSANGVGVSPKGYWGAFFDGRYVYFSPEWQDTIQEHGEVLRYDTTLPFNQAASWRTFDAGANGVGTDPDGYKCIVSDGTFLYFAPYYNGTASHGEVLRYDRRAAFDVASSWATFTPAANGVGAIAKGFEDAVFDGRYVYFVPSYSGFGPNAYHGEVLRYDTLAPFQTASSWAAFDPGSNGVGIDPDGYNGGTFDGRFIYFAPTNNGTGPHGEVLLYDTTKPFNSAASWLTYDPGANGIGVDPDGFAGTIFDHRYIYFVPDRNETGVPSGEVLRYDTGASIEITLTAAPATGSGAPSPSPSPQTSPTAGPLVSQGRLIAEVDSAVNTRVALVNPSEMFADVSFYFTRVDGSRVGSGHLILAPREQLVAFVDASPFYASHPFEGTLTFQSSQPIASAAMRILTNDRGEVLSAPIPVSMAPAGGIPNVAVGGGLSTAAILINPTDKEITGSLSVTGSGSGNRVGYRIAPAAGWRVSFSAAGPLRGGSLAIDADAGSGQPVGFAVMDVKKHGTTVSETSVVPVPEATTTHIFVESHGQPETGRSSSLWTSLVISNANSDTSACVTVELRGLDGQATGLRGVVDVPGRSQVTTLVNSILGFESLPAEFTGVLDVTSPSTPVAVAGSQERPDKHGAVLVVILPAIADGGLGTAQFVVFSGGGSR